MATRSAVIEKFGASAVRITWTGLLNGDSGEAVTFGVYTDRSVQVVGTFGAGGSVTMQGSNDNTNFVALSDARGNALAINSARIEQIEDLSYSIKPVVTAGDGTTSLTVVLFARSK